MKTRPGLSVKAFTLLTLQTIATIAFSAPVVLELRPPQNEVRIEKSTLLTMRDGTRLSTDIYFPVSSDSVFPVILMRTPYNKNTEQERSVSAARMFASRGYAVAVQDTRGRYESEGNFGIMYGDAEDGYDTVDWLAGQPWSNGKVGTYGCSYRGAIQILQARLKHRALAAMIPQAGPGAGLGYVGGQPRYLGIWRGGALELASTFSFIWSSGSKFHYQAPQNLSPEIKAKIAPYFDPAPSLPEIDRQKVLRYLPVLDMPDHFGAPPTDWEALLSHGFTDPWWNDTVGYFSEKDTIDVPMLAISSWHDVNVGHTLYRFNLFREKSLSKKSRNNQFVIISPTGHCGSEEASEHTVMGDLDLGDARLGHNEIYLRWFDHWLKGVDNGISNMPRVQYYLMGKNEWRSAAEWPLSATRYIRYFLHSDGMANSRFGSGRLSVDAPPDGVTTDSFDYDPATPVPSAVGEKGSIHGGPFGGPLDQRNLEMRHDILVYTSKPLPAGLEITGPLEAVLYVSSSARDTDFTVKLLDVHPDGRAFNLRAGILRARYRDGFDREVWMEPEKVYKIQIQMDPTSNYFATGHRIRLEVSSSNFPRFDRNLNNGGENFDETEWIVAKNQVHHGEVYRSHILLPIIPE
jgi:putative CocE/NonD family hydrolase